jgi:hypothetical protein
MNLQIYIWHMITSNSWATAAEVEAAAILLNCNIHVILEGQNVYISQTYSSNDTFSEIELLLARNHYRFLRKDLIEQNRTILSLDNYHTKQTQKLFWWIQHLSISFLPLANLKPFSFYLLLMPNMFVCIFHLIIY